MADSLSRKNVITESANTLKPAHRFARVGLLIVGDALSFITFAAVGSQSHFGSASLKNVVNIVWIAVPFAVGWFLVAPFLGAFSRQHTTHGLWRMLRRTELAWLCAWPVTLVLRWALAADHKIPVSFAVVVLLANAVFLGIWRSVFALIAGRLGRSE